MTPTATLRRLSVHDDHPVVADMFRTSRPELALLPPELIELQLRSRTVQRRAQHPDAVTELMDVDGVPVGVLVTSTDEESVHIVDLVVAEDRRGLGLGTAVLSDVIAEAHRTGRRVRLHVWSENSGARRLYQRLGFSPDDDQTDQSSRHLALSLRSEEPARHG